MLYLGGEIKMISQETIKEFQTELKKQYGRDIDRKEAESTLRDLVKYFDRLMKMAHEGAWSAKFGFLQMQDMKDYHFDLLKKTHRKS